MNVAYGINLYVRYRLVTYMRRFQWVFGPDFPDDHSWIRGLFQLLNGKKILVEYTPRGPSKPDCSEHVFGVLLRTVKVVAVTRQLSVYILALIT